MAQTPPPDLTLALADETATSLLGARLADGMVAGDCLLLEGPIGAGKSHLARAFIRHLLGPGTEVPSPTFTLVQCYDGPDCDIWHADLYRLGHPDEVLELGLEEAMETAICLIEWPDRLGRLAPADALRLRLEPKGEGRLAQLWLGKRGDLAADLAGPLAHG